MDVSQITPYRHGGIVVASQPVKLQVPGSIPGLGGLCQNLICLFMFPLHNFLHVELISMSQHGAEVPFHHIFFGNKLVYNPLPGLDGKKNVK